MKFTKALAFIRFRFTSFNFDTGAPVMRHFLVRTTNNRPFAVFETDNGAQADRAALRN